MSSAHRPTWEPAQGKDSRANSRIVSAKDLASHTRLKFRQAGQGSTAEISRRDLKMELLEAERQARIKRGVEVADEPAKPVGLITGAEGQKRILVDVVGLDADDSDDEEDEDKADKGKGKAKAVESEDDSEEEEDSDEDSEDETAELLKELEKIKRERAEEKERLEREKAASEQTSREEEIATGNPLLNLQAALGYNASPTPSTLSSSTGASSFGVKRRWDDDVIFKNQARGVGDKPKQEFV
ncbi:Cwf15/Cwc15 cell cycle control protein, partial [Pseudohyphozyma bogoriensis]